MALTPKITIDYIVIVEKNRTEVVSIRFTKSEFKGIKKKAASLKMSAGQYIRYISLNYDVKISVKLKN